MCGRTAKGSHSEHVQMTIMDAIGCNAAVNHTTPAYDCLCMLIAGNIDG